MLKALLGSQAGSWGQFQELGDEVLGIFGYYVELLQVKIICDTKMLPMNNKKEVLFSNILADIGISLCVSVPHEW